MYNGEVTEVKTTPKITQNYIPITSSNEVESPNDHILFEKKQEMIYFKNVKDNTVTLKMLLILILLEALAKYIKLMIFTRNFIRMRI